MSSDGTFPLWSIALILVPLTAYLIWKEWNRPFRFQILRCVAMLIMMISVALILLKPKYRATQSSSIILLTPEYSEKKVDSIVQSKPDLTIMHTADAKPYKNSKLLPYENLLDYETEIRFVLGQGLPIYALDLIGNRSFTFIPSPLPKGLTTLHLPETASANRKDFIAGTVNTSSDSSVIYLNGPADNEDSILIKEKGFNNFKLSFLPKQAGNFLYNLTIKDGAIVNTETFPMHIEDNRSLNILFIQSYPTFELQYLKSFLDKKNYNVALRYQLSKNKFRYEYLNRDPIKISRLTNEALSTFDLLIADQASLAQLSTAEKNVLNKSIQSGMGFLNLSANFKNINSDIFVPFQTITVKVDTTVISLESKSYNLPATSTRIAPHPFVIPIQKNKSGILSGYILQGAGKIAFQLLKETYRLTLSGDSSAYSELWTPLIEQVSRRHSQASKIRIITPFPRYQDQPIDIEVLSTINTPVLLDDSIRLPLRENVPIDNMWHARTWAGSPGWHLLKTEEGALLNYYVADTGAWKSLSIANQLELNKVRKHLSSEDILPDERVNQKEIPPLLFYIMFLCAAGFIWLAPKL